MTETPLKMLSFGAGAIGAYFGGSLADSGQQVVFLERPEVAAELRQRGLRLSLPEREIQIAAPVCAGSIEEALSFGPYDVALFALKSFDTRPVLEQIQAHQPDLPPVLCLQNGVENEPTIEEILGRGRVIAGSVTSAIGRRAAGDVILEKLRGVGLAGNHPLSERLAQAFNQAGLNARLYPHAAAMKWSKLLTNLVGNASSAILNMTPGEVFAHPGLYRLEIAQLRETLAVMRKLAIEVVDLPGTPVRLLAFGARFLPLAISRPLLQRAVGSGRGAKMPSFHIDLHSRRGQSEVDYLNGAVVRNGQRAGVATPANRVLNDTLLALTRQELALESFERQPEKLLERWQSLAN